MRRHEFIGVIDSAGCLSSYLFVTPKSARGIPGWMEIDHFTTTGSHEELYALVGALVRQPGLLGSARRILSLSSFAGDFTWDDAPLLGFSGKKKSATTSRIPSALKPLSKRTVLAEGDWGL
jgi:hypothetical protein